jgi:hypothetical protein
VCELDTLRTEVEPLRRSATGWRLTSSDHVLIPKHQRESVRQTATEKRTRTRCFTEGV